MQISKKVRKPYRLSILDRRMLGLSAESKEYENKYQSAVLDWNFQLDIGRRKRLNKYLSIIKYFKRWLPLTTVILILVIWQAWAQTQ